MNRLARSLVIAAGMLTPVLACAQRAIADPADPATRVPPLTSESVFSSFKRFEEIKVADWRRVNEEVAGQSVAGHSGHAGAAAPANAKEQSTAPKSPGTPPGHDQHMAPGMNHGAAPKQ